MVVCVVCVCVCVVWKFAEYLPDGVSNQLVRGGGECMAVSKCVGNGNAFACRRGW